MPVHIIKRSNRISMYFIINNVAFGIKLQIENTITNLIFLQIIKNYYKFSIKITNSSFYSVLTII
jgi:hypothetical protein